MCVLFHGKEILIYYAESEAIKEGHKYVWYNSHCFSLFRENCWAILNKLNFVGSLLFLT